MSSKTPRSWRFISQKCSQSGHHFVTTSTAECRKFESVCAIKRRRFFMPISVASRQVLREPYWGVRPSFNSSQAQSAGAEFVLFFPAWITHLSTPQGCGQPCGFVSYPRSKLTPSVCKTHSVSHTPVAPLRRFFLKKTKETGSGIAANPCPRVLPTQGGQPTAPLLIGRQVAGGRAPKGAQGRSPGGRGAAGTTPGAALGGGGTRGEASRVAATPLARPQRGPDMVPRCVLRTEREGRRWNPHEC